MRTKLTRRELAALVAAAPALAQSGAPEGELEAALERRRRDAEELAKQQVPMSTEPAFVFKP
jgi:hypothetical protein